MVPTPAAPPDLILPSLMPTAPHPQAIDSWRAGLGLGPLITHPQHPHGSTQVPPWWGYSIPGAPADTVILLRGDPPPAQASLHRGGGGAGAPQGPPQRPLPRAWASPCPPLRALGRDTVLEAQISERRAEAKGGTAPPQALPINRLSPLLQHLRLLTIPLDLPVLLLNLQPPTIRAKPGGAAQTSPAPSLGPHPGTLPPGSPLTSQTPSTLSCPSQPPWPQAGSPHFSHAPWLLPSASGQTCSRGAGVQEHVAPGSSMWACLCRGLSRSFPVLGSVLGGPTSPGLSLCSRGSCGSRQGILPRGSLPELGGELERGASSVRKYRARSEGGGPHPRSVGGSGLCLEHRALCPIPTGNVCHDPVLWTGGQGPSSLALRLWTV